MPRSPFSYDLGLGGRMTVSREERLREKYGLDMHDYGAMLLTQHDRCAICGEQPEPRPNGTSSFDVDHNHQTGRVRGLVCRRCNLLVAWAEALARLDPDLRAAIEAWVREDMEWQDRMRNIVLVVAQHDSTVVDATPGGPLGATDRERNTGPERGRRTMADLKVEIRANTAPIVPEPDIETLKAEVRRQVFEATGYSLTDDQLAAVLRSMTIGARFDEFVEMMKQFFADDPEQAIHALNEFARMTPDPIS